ncbi:MAG: hypothetical protein U0840_26240 [Gemmataceae bacterium]
MRRQTIGWMMGGLLLILGCANRGAVSEPALQAGDVVVPELAVAPEDAWEAGAEVVVTMLLKVQRAGRAELSYLHDEDVPAAQARMIARLSFLDSDGRKLAPIEVPLVKDC